jgi:predicted Zn-dependent protease
MDQWETLGLGVGFEPVLDTTDADIVVRWIDRFDFDRAGQTDLTWDQAGRIRKASITLALRTNTGVTLPDGALRTVALHETGHALGLPHSADSNDVMFPSAKTKSLSERDRRSAQVLYQLPPGPLRDPAVAP